MAGASCIYAPEVNGERSQLYMDLLTKHKLGRPLTNYIYAMYLTSNLAATLDANHKNRNSQNEHNALDVLEGINFSTIQNEISGLSGAERQLGAVDSSGRRVDFTDSKYALEQAERFNSTHTGLVARVQQVGMSNQWNIIVEQKDSKTNTFGVGVKERLDVWHTMETAFQNIGVDINNVPREIYGSFNPFNHALAQNLSLIQNAPFQQIRKDSALILFNIGMKPTDPHMQRLINNFGSLQNAAQMVEDINTGVVPLTASNSNLVHLLQAAVQHCQQFQGMDMTALSNQVFQQSQQIIQQDDETNIAKKIADLHQQFGIDINEIERTNSRIEKLSEAAAETVILLKRQIREIERREGRTTRSKTLESALNQLLRELENKKYYAGMMSFLQDASTQIASINALFQSMPTIGTGLKQAFDKARILQDIKRIDTQYYDLIYALSSDALFIDERIDPADIARIRQEASKLKKSLDEYRRMVNEQTEEVMTDLLIQIIGNTMPDGQAVINAIKMGAVDSTIWDFLYSMGTVSNPMIAAMGKVIGDAQQSRTGKMVAISKRIDRATDRLYKSGSNSKFIYEDEGHIISDIDWAAYEAAKEAEKVRLIQQGLRKGDLTQALKDWEDQNTEDRVVDTTNGRTERVPNANYRNNKATWDNVNHKMIFNPGVLTPAQQEYYDTMMQIKGEIGSLLPDYAQNHYFPPQLRRKMLDALGEAKSAQDVWKAVKNKIQDMYKIREDDTEFNVVTSSGEEGVLANGDYDNTPLRQIPIFFLNKIEEGELLKDFSSGISALAGTAINYDAMSNIQQVIEFMQDYVENKIPPVDEIAKIDKAENDRIAIVKHLISYTKNTNTHKLLEGFISQHLFGQRIDPKTPGYKWRKAITKLIGYTSLKGLATNVKGFVSNYLVGEYQMLIECFGKEFYTFSDYLWAHSKLFGKSGVAGEMAEIVTNNVSHKGTLFRDLFDPLSETFSDKMHKRYHTSLFRQLTSRDCSFIGYTSGEYLLHYVNMYSVLHHEKVLLNGRKICLYDAYEVTPKQDGNSELRLKQGVTDLNGNALTGAYKEEFEAKIKNRIKYINGQTHGEMDAESKGLIHQKLWGRLAANFKQWMVGHYSRRFRTTHFDWLLGEDREGYWYTYYNQLWNDKTKQAWKDGKKADAMAMFMRDFYTFTFRAQAQWSNLDEMQRANINRVRGEMTMFILLTGLGFAMGEANEHKEEFWRRWWIYQVKRLQLEASASMPNLRMLSSGLTILQSPMASVSVCNSLLYCFYGLTNGDITTELKSGPHKGENKYVRNVMKNALPFFKDWEQLQNMDTEDAIFKVFDDSPSNK